MEPSKAKTKTAAGKAGRGKGGKEDRKEEARPDQLHVLNEEFAQAIIFKRNELMQEECGGGDVDPARRRDLEERATKAIMEHYFE